MDRRKSGLKGKGLVMPDTNLDEDINIDGLINAGNPGHLIGSRFNKKVSTIGETKRDMYLAQEKLIKVLINLLHDDHANHEDIENLSEISAALAKGINFLEHIKKVITALNPTSE